MSQRADHRALPELESLKAKDRLTTAPVTGDQKYLDHTSELDKVIAAMVELGLFDDVVGEVFDLSLPQAPLTATIDADKTLLIKNSNGDNFADSLVSASEVVNVINALIDDLDITFYWGIDKEVVVKYRDINPVVLLRNSNDSAYLPDLTIVDAGIGSGNITLLFADIQGQTNGVNAFLIKLSNATWNIILLDQSGAIVTPTATDTSTEGEVEYTLPPIALPVSIGVGAGEQNPTVGEEITVTITSTGADSFCIWFGNGDSDAGAATSANQRAANYTYWLPGVYTLQGGAWIQTTGAGGGVLPADQIDVTVDGLLDTYGSGTVLASAPFLLYREYAGDALRLRRDSDNATDEIPFTDGQVDESAIGAFIGANNGFTERVYLQNSGGLYFEQTTAASQPQVVDSGLIIIDGFQLPTLEFDGTDDFMTVPLGNYWGADRSKLAIWGIMRAEANGSATNIIFSDYESSTGDRVWRVYWDDVSERLEVAYSVDGLFDLQTIEFSGLSTNETAFIFVQIDTAGSVNDRIKAWRTDESGTTALTRVATDGNKTGNLHLGVGDIAIGIQNPASPNGYFNGSLSFGGLRPELVSQVEREALQDYVQGYITQ